MAKIIISVQWARLHMHFTVKQANLLCRQVVPSDTCTMQQCSKLLYLNACADGDVQGQIELDFIQLH